MSKESKIQELSDDIEVVGPGQMLAQARCKMGLSQQDVADRLNFRTTLVKGIEEENFDPSVPATFNRGYLRNYAKLVNLSADEVLSAYEMLNIAQQQCAELQSFSKGTEKQAESNLIMWISYLILAVLIGSTIVWWLQETKDNNETFIPASLDISTKEIEIEDALVNKSVTDNRRSANTQVESDNIENGNVVKLDDSLHEEQKKTNTIQSEKSEVKVSLAETLMDAPIADETQNKAIVTELKSSVVENSETLTQNDLDETSAVNSEVLFTFTGDCWVNIYDATGERLAWGIKKSGYVMTVSGQAPFNITLGKPELVTIEYNENVIDMSQFNRGNIAKFSLPLP